MSLGVRLIRRAQSRGAVKGLSLVPRESRIRVQCASSWTPSWTPLSIQRGLSSSTTPPSVDAEETPATGAVEAATRVIAEKYRGIPRDSSSLMGAVYGRHLSKQDIKRLLRMDAQDPALIQRPRQYRGRYATHRSLRLARRSFLMQVLHRHNRDTLGRPVNDWRRTMDFMLRHTPNYGKWLNFKVKIGRSVAAQARSTLSDLNSSLAQIQKRHNSKIRIEDPGVSKNDPLLLCLEGSNVSVRESLSDVIRAVGTVSAMRVLDPHLKTSIEEAWSHKRSERRLTRLLGRSGTAAEDDTITVYNDSGDINLIQMARSSRPKTTVQTIRADAIPRPTVWNTFTFEAYVAKLVSGRVPTHLHRTLYPTGLSHQETVASLLVDLFASADMRPAMSASALKLALQYLNRKGWLFRNANRVIYYYAEQYRLPLEIEAFHCFLHNASYHGDMRAFNWFLVALARKGHYIRGETWAMFIIMFKDPQIKQYIISRMNSRGLYTLKPVLAELGRQIILMKLERESTKEKIDIVDMVKKHDREWGKWWLNETGLNQVLDELGAQGRLDACDQLLAFVASTTRVQPGRYTRNTMVTHTRSIPAKIATIGRWPHLRPDEVTFSIMFQTAWKNRLPNMLHVTWRYAVFAKLTSSRMRHVLTTLMYLGEECSKAKTFLRDWREVILGRRELAAGRALSRKEGEAPLGAAQLMHVYFRQTGKMRPSLPYHVMLQRAYEMDMRIHRDLREGGEIGDDRKVEEYAVSIPLHVPPPRVDDVPGVKEMEVS